MTLPYRYPKQNAPDTTNEIKSTEACGEAFDDTPRTMQLLREVHEISVSTDFELQIRDTPVCIRAVAVNTISRQYAYINVDYMGDTGASLRRYERCSGSSGIISTQCESKAARQSQTTKQSSNKETAVTNNRIPAANPVYPLKIDVTVTI